MVEPRGIGVSNEGELAVADPGLGEIIFFDAAQSLQEGGVPEPLKQPEAVTWTPDGVLVIADNDFSKRRGYRDVLDLYPGRATSDGDGSRGPSVR